MKKPLRRGVAALFVVCLTLFCAFAAGCGGNPGPDNGKGVTSVTLNETSLELFVNDTAQLTAAVLPADAKDPAVTWTSSAPDVATVENGLVRARAVGSATVTAATENGKSATCNVTVKAYVTPAEQTFAMAFDPADYLSLQGSVKGTVSYAGKSVEVAVRKGDEAAVSALAVIDDKNGFFLPLSAFAGVSGAGRYTFEVQTPFAPAALELAMNLTAVDQSFAFLSGEGWSNSPNGEGELKANGRIAVVGEQTWGWVTKTVEVDFDRASVVDVKIKNASHNWAVKVTGGSLTESVPLFPECSAAVSKQKTVDLKSLTGLAGLTGKQQIRFDVFATGALDAYTDMDYLRLTGGSGETLQLVAERAFVALADVTLSADHINAKMGETVDLKESVAFVPANATNRRLTYVSSKPAVVKVSAEGILTPASVGDAEVSLTSADGAIRKTIAVNVRVALTGLSLAQPSGTFRIGEGSCQLQPVFAPADATNRKVTYAVVSGGEVASVSANGEVTFLQVGDAVLRVTAEDGGFTADYALTVKQDVKHVAAVTLTPDCFAGGKGDTCRLTAAVEPADADDKSVRYASSDERVVTVNDEGLATIVGNGKATITVTSNDGAKTAACAVTSYPAAAFDYQAEGSYEWYYLSFAPDDELDYKNMRAVVDVRDDGGLVKTASAPITLSSSVALPKAKFAVADLGMSETKRYELVFRLENEAGEAVGNGFRLVEFLPVEAADRYAVGSAGDGWTAGGAPLAFDAGGKLVLAAGGYPYGWVQRDVNIDFDHAPYFAISVSSAETLWSVVFNYNNKDVKLTPDMAVNENGVYLFDLRNRKDIYSGAEHFGELSGLVSATLRIFLNKPDSVAEIPTAGLKTKVDFVGFYRERSEVVFSVPEELRLLRGTKGPTGVTVSGGDAGYAVNYLSNNPAVAAVSADGTVTALAPGYAELTVAYAVGGETLQSKTAKVFVGSEFVYRAADKADYVVASVAEAAADQSVRFAVYEGETLVGATSCTVEVYNRVAADLSGIALTDGKTYNIFASTGSKATLGEYNLVHATKAEFTASAGWVNSGAEIQIPADRTADIKAGYGFLDLTMTVDLDSFDYFFWKVDSLTAGVVQSFGIRTARGISYYSRGWGMTGEGVGVAKKSQIASESVPGCAAELLALTGTQQISFTILLESPGGVHDGQKIDFGAVCSVVCDLLA